MEPEPQSLSEESGNPIDHGSTAWHAGVCIVAALLVVGAFFTALRGEFVYDDRLEIVRNPYIQHTRYLWRALTSDVWAFKGEREAAWSNYWRPVFVAWMTLNYRLFGLNPLGWHVTSILAHLAATLLVYRALIALGIRTAVAAVVTWVFGVHPVQVESVAWVSGIPNSLAAIGLLGSYVAYLKLRERPSISRWVAALGCYAFALLSREGTVVYPAILLGTEWLLRGSDRTGRGFTRPAIRRCAPFAVAAIAFAIARYFVLGIMRIQAPGAPGLVGVLMTAPSLIVFYVRQILAPIQLGPIYDMRAVNDANAGLWNFWFPLATLIVAFGLVARFSRGIVGLGLLWFCIPLIPVLEIRSFPLDQLVHDRYLYLPLIGSALVVFAGLAAQLDRLFRGRRHRADRLLAGVGLALAVGLGLTTRQYNPVWRNEVALWERGVQTAPDSPTAFHQLGEAHRVAGHLSEARAALLRSLELEPDLTLANVALASLAIRERKFDEAEPRLTRVLAIYPDLVGARDQLALCYQQQGFTSRAIQVFDEGRRLIPYKRITYTVNIAVLLAQTGQKHQALAELDSIAEQLEGETDPHSIKAWWYMGELCRELGQASRAADAYGRFAEAAERSGNAELLRLASRTRREIVPSGP